MKKKFLDFIEELFFLVYEYSLQLGLAVKDRIKGRKNRLVAFALLFPWMTIWFVLAYLYEHTIGFLIVSIKLFYEQKKKFKYDLSICLIEKNEADYIKEWLAYHEVITNNNVHFYIYDNGSTDDIKEKLKVYIEKEIVTFIDYPGEMMQQPAYNDAIRRFKNESRYIAFIDADEFILPKAEDNLTDLVLKLMKKKPNVAGIGVNWNIFGSNGYKTKPEGLVIESYTKRGDEKHWGNTHIKTICNPRFVKFMSTHFAQLKLGAICISPDGKRQRLWWNKKVNWDILSINHYFCKSEEEFWKKRNRGKADGNDKYEFVKFQQYDSNNIEDTYMLRFADKIYKRMSET